MPMDYSSVTDRLLVEFAICGYDRAAYSIKDIDRVGDTKLSNYRRIRIAPTEIYTYDDLRRRE